MAKYHRIRLLAMQMMIMKSHSLLSQHQVKVNNVNHILFSASTTRHRLKAERCLDCRLTPFRLEQSPDVAHEMLQLICSTLAVSDALVFPYTLILVEVIAASNNNATNV